MPPPMHECTSVPDDAVVAIKPKQTLLDGLLKGRIPITHACGGRARCSTCRVLVEDGLDACLPRSRDERSMAEHLCFDDTIRLACQTKIRGAVRVRRLVLDNADEMLASQLMTEEDEAAAVGRELKLGILFCDAEGFTSLSEALPAYDVVHLLNRWFERVGRVVRGHGGRIDNYMGDGFIALFGLEEDDPGEPAPAAVRCGLALFPEAAALSEYTERLYRTPFKIRVGVHYGTTVVGALGAPGRRRDTVIGDAVNLASRIEAANKETGTRLLVSEDTYEALGNRFETGGAYFLELKGKSGRYQVIEITGELE